MLPWAIGAGALVGLLWSSWRKPRLTASIVWATTATIFGTAALTLLLPSNLKPTLLWMSIATPLIWVGFLFWCHWDERPYRPVVGTIAITLAGIAAVVAIPPPA